MSYLRCDLLENSLFPYRLILGMVTLSNTLTSMLAGSAEFSDPVTKVTYDRFSKVPLRLGLVSASVRAQGERERCSTTTLGCERSWEKRLVRRQREVGRW